MESIIGLSKTEWVRPGPFHTGPFKTLSDVESATMAWVGWYNDRRLHATLGMRTQPNTEPPTTLPPLPSNRSRSPYEDGTKPVTVQPRTDSGWAGQGLEQGRLPGKRPRADLADPHRPRNPVDEAVASKNGTLTSPPTPAGLVHHAAWS